MKISLALGRAPLSRQTAWGCFTTNLALPGFGSLVAGRRIGYAQAAFALTGMALTIVFGGRFILWYLSNWQRIRDPNNDPSSIFGELWHVLRWAILGFVIFGVGWLWALMSSFGILAEARRDPLIVPPPRLK